MLKVPSSGPCPADVMIVGEAPGADEEIKRAPFVGMSGKELDRMLHEVGFIRADMRVANVCRYRPPGNDISHFIETARSKAVAKGMTHFWKGKYFNDLVEEGREELRKEIAEVRPKMIIALGETALWALCGVSGITSWRGSLLNLHEDMGDTSIVVIPTYHPAAILRMWDWRAIAVRDLKRASDYIANPSAYSYPPYAFSIRPTLTGVTQTLQSLLSDLSKGSVRIACDIETIARHIACVGIAWSELEAICIPFIDAGGKDYWNEDEEVHVYGLLKKVLTHPNAFVIGQNFNYDRQHFAKHWGYSPNLRFDTMLAQHVLFPGLPKSLDFLSSMYCRWHRYWKDELKEYHKMPSDVHQFWSYNAKDCVITWEVANVLDGLIDGANLREQFNFQMRMNEHVFRTMLRGIKVDVARRSKVANELMEAIGARERLIHQIVGEELNVGSPKQMKEFFYDSLGFQPILHRKTKKPTLDDDALRRLTAKNPIIAPLVELITEKRSLGVFLSTFCLMPLDSDLRMRTSYNVAGTETFRFSSGENAFGSGGNLQNIPKGDEK